MDAKQMEDLNKRVDEAVTRSLVAACAMCGPSTCSRSVSCYAPAIPSSRTCSRNTRSRLLTSRVAGDYPALLEADRRQHRARVGKRDSKRARVTIEHLDGYAADHARCRFCNQPQLTGPLRYVIKADVTTRRVVLCDGCMGQVVVAFQRILAEETL